MSFHELPTELVNEIFSWLRTKKDLTALCCCNKQFHQIAIPLLYSSVKQTNSVATNKIFAALLSEPRRTHHIKHLESHIRAISMNGDAFQNTRADRLEAAPIQCLPFEHLQRLKDILIAAVSEKTKAEAWYQWLSTGTRAGGTAVLLLLMAPDVESYTLRYLGGQELGYPTVGEWLGEIIAMCADRQRQTKLIGASTDLVYCLPKLKKIRVEFSAVHGRQLNNILLFAQLDSLTTLICFNVEGQRERFKDAIVSGVTDLSLKRSWLDFLSLQQLILIFPNLRRFEYQHKVLFAPYTRLVPTAIWKAIQPLKNALEELILGEGDDSEVESEDGLSDEWRSGCDPIGSLITFRKLRILDATICTMMGRVISLRDRRSYFPDYLYTADQHKRLVSSFPASLECLVLRDCPSEIVDTVAAIFKHVKAGTGLDRLKRVELVFYVPEFYDSVEKVAYCLEDEGMKLGIALILRYSDYAHRRRLRT